MKKYSLKNGIITSMCIAIGISLPMVLHSIPNAGGHLDSIRRMVESGRDCSEVLIQLAAVK